METLTLEQARDLLADHEPQTAAQQLSGRRVDNGWLFTWDTSAGEVPLGMPKWLVYDDQRYKGVTFRDNVDGA